MIGLLIKLLLLPIWLPLKIIAELLEHSTKRRSYRRAKSGSQPMNRGCAILLSLAIVVVSGAIIIAVASAPNATQPDAATSSPATDSSTSPSPPLTSASSAPVAVNSAPNDPCHRG